MMAHVCHYVMLHAADAQFVGNPQNKKQYGLKAGLQKFADRGNTAVMKELTQFHTMNVFCPMNPKKLTRDDRRNALSSLMFLTEKQSGEVKDKTISPKKKQRPRRLLRKQFSFKRWSMHTKIVTSAWRILTSR
jgi:hypothetical protein